MANAFDNLFTNIKREKLMSVSNIVVMTVSFMVLGVFIFVVAGSQTALRYLEQQAQITAFFKDDFLEANILSYKGELEKDGRVSEVKYISKQEAFLIFSEINKDEPILLESISANVLPASLEIKTVDIADLSGLAAEIQQKEGVEEVRFFEDVIQRFKVWSSIIYVIGFVLVAVFLLISYSIVIATLRTTINSKGVELEIMKLVGASNSYVRSPLILQGVFFGLVSSVISAIFMIFSGVFLNKINFFDHGVSFGFLPGLYVSVPLFSVILSIILILSGCVLGFVGSYTAVKRYLRY